MPYKSTKMSIAEHIEMGKKVKLIQELSYQILDKVSRSYGKSCRAAKLAERMVKISKFVHEMDVLVIRETTYKEWNDKGYGRIYLGGEYKELKDI